MDSITHFAVEQICAQGATGIHLQALWPILKPTLASSGLPLSPSVKRALWANIVDIPGLQFLARPGPVEERMGVRDVEKCEEMNVRVVADEKLRDCFIGIYDVRKSDITPIQRRTLERLAVARSEGIAQSELAKEFGIKGNNIFYILKKLETRGLISRQPTVIRTKEASSETESKIVSTNMLHLYRYAKHLSCQQKLEITKEERCLTDGGFDDEEAANDDGFSGELAKEDIVVKDYLPNLKAICDKLDKATKNVLVVSDIKRDLGYCGTHGHRAWRNIFHRLKDAHVVEDFTAKVNNKEVSCLRLLKKFSPQHFQSKNRAYGSNEQDPEQSVKLGKRGHVTEQLMELPIVQQIYDMFDAEGSKGLTITEVCKRLGIPSKQYYTRLLDLFSRFGMHLLPESHNRGVAYRIWTSGNINPESSNIVPSPQTVGHESTESNPRDWDVGSSALPAQDKDDLASEVNGRVTLENEGSASNERKLVLHGSMEQNSQVQTLEHNKKSGHTIQEIDALSYKIDGESDCIAIGSDGCDGSTTDKQPTSRLQVSNNLESSASETGDVPMEDLQIASLTPEDLQIVSLTSSSVLPMSPPKPEPRKRRSYLTYPCLTLGATSSLREQRILKMLQEERFLIKPELHRRLESLDKDKKTMMDRKTLDRTLNKLQQEGHCKCIHISVPVITHCGRSRTTVVVLHPSIYDPSPEVLGQIHERMRSFEIQIRQQNCSPLNKVQDVPELSDVQRIPYHTKSDLQSELAEARRTNGFVLAKMVRTKLLHIFLWGYISSTPGWDNDLSYGRQGHDTHNPHSSCKLFEPDTALKAMPIELFLQIVGSTQRFEDMIDKCKRGLRLSDLPVHECSSLMDTRAIGRLSELIHILRRLKLIRLVSGGTQDISKPPHTRLTDALELKPYLEEPASIAGSSLGFFSPDIRPQIRHDFVLSSRKVVDEYWLTLEYCYSAADTNAARHAFPGSAVHEIFRPRSWASVRLMTAEQRAELLKRVGNEDPDKKLTYRECNVIAKDLNLTLEQVLRVDYDRRRQKLTRIYGKKQGVLLPESSNLSSLRKRKRSSNRKSSKHVDEALADRELCNLDQYDEEQYTLFTPDDDEYSLHYEHINDYEEDGDDEEPNEHVDNIGFKCALSRLKRKRQRKFSWTEQADRQLVIEYARNRAALGANFHRTIWASLSNLPAPPDTCRRRMAMLNTSVPFRKSLMRLCNKLTDRYAKYLKKFQHDPLYPGDSRGMIRDYTVHKDNHQNISDGSQNLESEDVWDNFDEPDIQTALNDVFRYKKIAKREASKGVEDTEHTELLSSPPPSQEAVGHGIQPKTGQRSGSNRLPPRYSKFLREGSSANKAAYKSVAVSNAIELFKLIFLSTSTAPEAPALLAETLRRYSEHDLFSAFNYLREKKIMIGGSGNSPFELSQSFLSSISLSPFPVNTGKRAAKFAHWLQEKEKDLTEAGIELPEDFQCGDLMHLCALISLKELSITPLLPDDGVGEAEDTKTLKRKHDDSEICISEKTKKLRSSVAGEGEIICRREKGFPGIKLCLNLAAISRMDALQLFNDNYAQTNHVTEPNKAFTRSGMDDCNLLIRLNKPSCFNELHEPRNSLHLTDSPVEAPWEAMASFAQHLLSSCSSQERAYSFHPDLFKKACVAIHKAGDQGLNIKEVSKIMNIEEERLLEITIEVLEAFGRALKVNTFDSEHMVDSLYRSKYFLIPVASLHQDPKSVTLRVSKEKKDDVDDHEIGTQSWMKMSENCHEVHRVTILNLPEEAPEPLQGSQSIDRNVGHTHNECTSAKSSGHNECTSTKSSGHYECTSAQSSGHNECTLAKSSGQDVLELHPTGFDSYRPILPWINGDGTVNEIIYKGLVRRVLGIIMQNPGILEEDIMKRLLPILNPQSCRKMLKIMILDNHISVRKMPQKTSAAPPPILYSILGSNLRKSSMVCRDHIFANPSSTMLM